MLVLTFLQLHKLELKTHQSQLILNSYSIEHTPTESSAGGTLLHISKRFSYQLRNDSTTQKNLDELL